VEKRMPKKDINEVVQHDGFVFIENLEAQIESSNAQFKQ
jgi:hypothetical protein